MYFASVVLLLLILPLASIAIESELFPHHLSVLSLTGKWFVFWGAGARLFLAGVRQVTQPQFTAEEIFRIREVGAFPIVRELGFANLSMGLLGLCSIAVGGWTVPAAIVGGSYYGLAGIGHIFQEGKNAKEKMAMISDAFICVVLVGFLLTSVF
jgi:uncharacterized protein DUF6790